MVWSDVTIVWLVIVGGDSVVSVVVGAVFATVVWDTVAVAEVARVPVYITKTQTLVLEKGRKQLQYDKTVLLSYTH